MSEGGTTSGATALPMQQTQADSASRPQRARDFGAYVGAALHMAHNARQVLLARLYLRGCELGRYVRVTGRPVIVSRRGSQIVLGERVRINSTITPCELGAGPGARLQIGAHTSINYGTSLGATKLVQIGERCEIGTYVNVIDNNFHDLYDRSQYPDSRPVIIEDEVWLCSRVMVLPGAHIERGVVLGAGSLVQPGVRVGHHAIVAAGSVVHENVAPRSVVMGNPARTIYTLPEPPKDATAAQG
jgi:acetyltransferase-like isoleucine patch superfamily enzyme